MSNQPTVTLADLPNIKRQYTKAVKANKLEFTCWLTCGVQAEFLVSYAKYLIEHLTNVKNEQTKNSIPPRVLRTKNARPNV